MISLQEILNLSESKVSDVRKIDYFLRTKEFLQLYEVVDIEALKTLRSIICECDLKKLKDWVHTEKINYDVGMMSVRELRKLASKCKVSDYHILTKDELIYEIRDVISKRADNSSSS